MSTGKTLMFSHGAGDVTISSMRNWCIIISNDAAVSERYAAEESQKWFNQATSLTLPLETAQENTSFNEGQVNISVSSTMSDEEIHITVENNQIQISGGLPRGVLYAVHQLSLIHISEPTRPY